MQNHVILNFKVITQGYSYYFHLFIHSFYFYSASSSLLLLRGAPDTARILRMLEFHAEAPPATVSEGLAPVPYMAARV